MITLVVIFLVGLYILKIFFPQEFIMVIENQHLIDIGNFIDNNIWLYEICCIITSFITYWLYFCAVLRKWKLNLQEILITFIVIITTHIVYEFDVVVSSCLSVISMILIPLYFKSKYSDVAIVFSIHYLSQSLSISIRSLPSLLTNVNFINMFLMTIECYFWLLLFYLYFNFKKESINYG